MRGVRGVRLQRKILKTVEDNIKTWSTYTTVKMKLFLSITKYQLTMNKKTTKGSVSLNYIKTISTFFLYVTTIWAIFMVN